MKYLPIMHIIFPNIQSIPVKFTYSILPTLWVYDIDRNMHLTIKICCFTTKGAISHGKQTIESIERHTFLKTWCKDRSGDYAF